MISSRWTAAIAATAALLSAVPARGQLTIDTLAGRQLGDGRQATAAALDRPFGVGFALDGALLIADRGQSRIRRVDPGTGIITTRAGSISGSRNGVQADQGEMQGPVTVNVDPANGNILIADRDQHAVRRVSGATNVITRIAGFPNSAGSSGDGGSATSALLNGPADAVADGAGGILIADRSNNKIRRIDAGGDIDTVAGTGVAGYSGDDLPAGATAAKLNSPNCVLPIPPGDGGGFYLCDTLNNVIRRVDGAGTITTVAGTGAAGLVDGAALAAELDHPLDLAFDANGNLLIAEEGNSAIRHLDLDTETVSTLAGTGAVSFTADGAPALGSPLATPRAVSAAPDGRVVFAEEGSHRVRAIDAGGNLVTLAGDGISSFGGDGGPALDAQLGQVMGVSRDAAGRLLVSDDGNARVRRVDPCTGLIETIVGSGTRAFGGDGGLAVNAGITPYDTLEDADGNLIIADTDNDRIRIVDANGMIDTLVGTGVGGYTGDGGSAATARINRPWGIELDAAGDLYIADFDNDAVRKVSAGIITTVAGTGTSGYNGDGILATTARLNNPSDVAIDASGNLYIADHHNHRIRRVDAATQTITTVAGTGVEGFGGDGGPATSALLDEPMDVKVDETGAIWITDFQNQRIRRFTLGGNIDTVAGTGLRGYEGDGGPATAARLHFPFRLFMIASDKVLVSERNNFIVRGLGTITAICGTTTTSSSSSSSTSTSTSSSSSSSSTSPVSSTTTTSDGSSSSSTSSSSTLPGSPTSTTSSSSATTLTIGTSTTSTTEPGGPDPGCTGVGAATCIPGGKTLARDCFGEFRVEARLSSALPPPRVTCVDGDPECDADGVVGQCTFRVALCFNNTDARIPCTPAAIRSVVLKGPPAASAGGQSVLQGIVALGATATKARGATFDRVFTDLNQCTPYGDFVVGRGRTRAAVLRAVVATQAAGRDKNRLKLVCVAP